MDKEQLELKVLDSNLEDTVKLELIRCVEKAFAPVEPVNWPFTKKTLGEKEKFPDQYDIKYK